MSLEDEIMSKKSPNLEIGCTVRSCAFHCGDMDQCSLPGITVEACPGCSSGCAKDESMCGSYRAK